jgi:hypothetical protein
LATARLSVILSVNNTIRLVRIFAPYGASWHVQQGTPLHVLQELGGWSDYEMVRRYAHLSVEHLAEYADGLSKVRLVSTKLAQSENGAEKKQIA